MKDSGLTAEQHDSEFGINVKDASVLELQAGQARVAFRVASPPAM
jgi:hypothetical protein